MDYASNVDQEPDWSVPAADDLLSSKWPETGFKSIFIFGFDSWFICIVVVVKYVSFGLQAV